MEENERMPVEREILENAKKRFREKQQLSPVEVSLITEHLQRARVQLRELDSLGVKETVSSREKRQQLQQELDNYPGFI